MIHCLQLYLTHVSFDFFSLDSLCGFIHNLSPVKQSRKTDWFEFHLQTSPSKVQRVVGFNIPSHSTFSEHNKSKNPVLLSNTKKNESNKDVIFNQQSIVRSAPAFDIDFDYSANIAASESSSPSVQPAATITLEQVPTLKINQKVNVTATNSVGSEQPEPVEVKSAQKMTLVKEDCVLEDESGTAEIHIWDELINKVKNGTTYEFQNLNVKHFKGSTHLTTTPATTFKEASKPFKSVQGPSLLENPEKEVKEEMFKFLSNLSVFVACQACKTKITERVRDLHFQPTFQVLFSKTFQSKNIQYRSEISELRIRSLYAHTHMTIRVCAYYNTRMTIRVYVFLCYSPLTVSFVRYCWTKQ